ncbi:MAG: serine/threonine protein kinase [Chloroflexi bacterium]|nr:serine/threonine protein kinase [Chloroflexota bacterium]
MVTTESAVGGRYQLLRPLGMGGYAEVWLATDDDTGRQVALKLPRRERSALAPTGAAGCRRELAAAARLSHPNIVRLLDSGMDRGEPYLVFEYVDGPSLREALSTGGALPPSEVVRLGSELAGALAYAHSRGVLHNDIKPENILLARDGAKLADFGAAAGLSRTLTASATHELAGTVAYLAPEVLQGAAASEASDIYSLALVLFEAAAGRLPWPGATAAAVAGQRLATPAPPLRSAAPGMPPAFEDAIARALSRSPAVRPASVAAFGAALVAQPEATVAIVAPTGAARASPTPAAPAAPRGSGPRVWMAATVAGIAVLATAGAGVALQWTGGSSGDVSRQTPTVTGLASQPATPAAASTPAATATPRPATGFGLAPTPIPTPRIVLPGKGKGDVSGGKDKGHR